MAPARGKGSDSNQVMDRIVAQILTEIDGVGSKGKVFVIGATNRPDLLDSSLLRPGRFDKQIYLGVADKKEERLKIMKAQTRKMVVDDEVDFDVVESMVPLNFTGADFAALTNEAYMIAARNKIKEIEAIVDQETEQYGIKEQLQPESIFEEKVFVRS